jgi:hypothetical protein
MRREFQGSEQSKEEEACESGGETRMERSMSGIVVTARSRNTTRTVVTSASLTTPQAGRSNLLIPQEQPSANHVPHALHQLF